MQVGPHVGVQLLVRIFAENHRGKTAVAKKARQVELGDFGVGEGIEVRGPRASPEKVGVPSLQLASAASGEDKMHSALLNQSVDLVEKRGKLLDLVDHDRRGCAPAAAVDHRFEQAGVGGESEKDVRTEQVDDGRLAAELLANEEALARRAWSEEEE